MAHVNDDELVANDRVGDKGRIVDDGGDADAGHIRGTIKAMVWISKADCP
jgi:hypothetical protein